MDTIAIPMVKVTEQLLSKSMQTFLVGGLGILLFFLTVIFTTRFIITNRLTMISKHFVNAAQQEEGNISIVLRSTNEDKFELTVSDDGVGIPEDLDIEQTDTMGLHLVKVLAEQTLEGKIELNRTEGTQLRFLLKRTKYKPRI